jgi:hypothetical protein
MPTYQDVQLMLDDVRRHIRETGHEAIIADDPRMRMLGFSCSDCEGPETVWECGVSVIVSLPPDSILRTTFRSLAGRVSVLRALNQDSTSRNTPSFEHLHFEEGAPQPTIGGITEDNLGELWGESEAREALVEQGARNQKAREDFETRVHDSIPTRFEREDPI